MAGQEVHGRSVAGTTVHDPTGMLHATVLNGSGPVEADWAYSSPLVPASYKMAD
jgi:hypothetical protein